MSDPIISNLQKAFKYLNEDPATGLTGARTAVEAIVRRTKAVYADLSAGALAKDEVSAKD